MSKDGEHELEELEEGAFAQFPSSNDIEKILEFPGINDMAGVLARANFRDETQRLAAVRLFYRNKMFHDDDHQEMLRVACASTLGKGGLGKILQTFASVKMLAPDMLRAALQMPKTKKPEEVHKSSDMRTQSDKEKEVVRE